MRFKSKYNVGDIVKFYNNQINDYEIGRIDCIKISYSFETRTKEKYIICPIKIEENYLYDGIEVALNFIRRKINKKAFIKAYEKKFAEQCAKEMK